MEHVFVTRSHLFCICLVVAGVYFQHTQPHRLECAPAAPQLLLGKVGGGQHQLHDLLQPTQLSFNFNTAPLILADMTGTKTRQIKKLCLASSAY